MKPTPTGGGRTSSSSGGRRLARPALHPCGREPSITPQRYRYRYPWEDIVAGVADARSRGEGGRHGSQRGAPWRRTTGLLAQDGRRGHHDRGHALDPGRVRGRRRHRRIARRDGAARHPRRPTRRAHELPLLGGLRHPGRLDGTPGGRTRASRSTPPTSRTTTRSRRRSRAVATRPATTSSPTTRATCRSTPSSRSSPRSTRASSPTCPGCSRSGRPTSSNFWINPAGERIGVPWTWGSIGLTYNSAEVDEMSSWYDLLDPSLAGKVGDRRRPGGQLQPLLQDPRPQVQRGAEGPARRRSWI